MNRLHMSRTTCLQTIGRLAWILSGFWLLATHTDKTTVLHTPNPGRCVHNIEYRHR